MALGLHLTVDIERAERDSVERRGDAHFIAINDENDLFLRALRMRWASRASPDRAVRAAMSTEIPTARGLGSSSVAVVAGVCAADALDGLSLDRDSIIAAATRIEGHPDNAAPAVLGGLTCATQRDEEVFALRLADLSDLTAVVLSPDATLTTSASRAVLPERIGHRDATRSLGRALYLSHALVAGRRDALAWAFEDAMHQPYRAALMPGLADAIAAAVSAGALGAWLSGAGSSSIALVRDDVCALRVSSEMQRAYAAAGVSVTARTLTIDAAGATVEAR